jgi:hypothetical protein
LDRPGSQTNERGGNTCDRRGSKRKKYREINPGHYLAFDLHTMQKSNLPTLLETAFALRFCRTILVTRTARRLAFTLATALLMGFFFASGWTDTIFE